MHPRPGNGADLRALRYFASVAETGSVTEGARRVGVAQPAVSRQLRRLEFEFGLALFDRRQGRIRLTAAGRRLLDSAREVLARADRLGETAAALRTGQVRQLQLVAPAVTINDLVAPYVAARGPGPPHLSVDDEMPARIATALDRGADLVIAPFPLTSAARVAQIARMPIWAYVPEDHPWSGRERVPIAELVRTPLLLPTADHWTRRVFDAAAEQVAARYCEVTECRLPLAAQALAAAHRGVAVVSDDARFGLRSLAIDGPAGPLRLPLYAAWEPGHYADRAIQLVVSQLAEYVIDRYGPEATGDPDGGDLPP